MNAATTRYHHNPEEAWFRSRSPPPKKPRLHNPPTAHSRCPTGGSIPSYPQTGSAQRFPEPAPHRRFPIGGSNERVRPRTGSWAVATGGVRPASRRSAGGGAERNPWTRTSPTQPTTPDGVEEVRQADIKHRSCGVSLVNTPARRDPNWDVSETGQRLALETLAGIVTLGRRLTTAEAVQSLERSAESVMSLPPLLVHIKPLLPPVLQLLEAVLTTTFRAAILRW